MRTLILVLCLAPFAAFGAESGYRLDRSPHDLTDTVSLQSGAATYMNYCLGCHGLQFMRYSGLTDIGLSEAQIRENLMFTADKVGEPIKAMVPAKESKAWFGVPPPDLSVIARSRGADWLYTYLRTFYRDPKTATGWNNAVFPNVGMPHVLWPLQGQRGLELVEHKDGAGHVSVERKWTEVGKGTQSSAEYDATVRDLVNFLVYASEPTALKRRSIGIIVLFVLGVLFIFAYLLKKEYWKDVK
jgi:ubiquinol-cytochrome c reductase cytochrome c1 subunit